MRKGESVDLTLDVQRGDSVRGGSREHARRTDALRERAERLSRGEYPDDGYAEPPRDVQGAGIVADKKAREGEDGGRIGQCSVGLAIDEVPRTVPGGVAKLLHLALA